MRSERSFSHASNVGDYDRGSFNEERGEGNPSRKHSRESGPRSSGSVGGWKASNEEREIMRDARVRDEPQPRVKRGNFESGSLNKERCERAIVKEAPTRIESTKRE